MTDFMYPIRKVRSDLKVIFLDGQIVITTIIDLPLEL